MTTIVALNVNSPIVSSGVRGVPLVSGSGPVDLVPSSSAYLGVIRDGTLYAGEQPFPVPGNPANDPPGAWRTQNIFGVYPQLRSFGRPMWAFSCDSSAWIGLQSIRIGRG
jgi:hypothetical protein